MFVFIETRVFTRLFDELFDAADLARLQSFLIQHPESGDIIPGSGGVRKLRWGAPGRGKRGGVRIIYYLMSKRGQIWLLTLYSETELANIPAQTLRKIKDEIDG